MNSSLTDWVRLNTSVIDKNWNQREKTEPFLITMELKVEAGRGIFLNMGQPRPLLGLLLQSFLQTQLQQTY